jgi:hypothetical protein
MIGRYAARVQDYSNPVERDFFDLDQPDKDTIDRWTTPRMPWQYVASRQWHSDPVTDATLPMFFFSFSCTCGVQRRWVGVHRAGGA